MSAPVRCVELDSPVQEVLRIFAQHPIHHLPVVKNRAVVGLISSSDILKLEFFLPSSGTARDRLLAGNFRLATLMRTHVITVSQQESIERASELMARQLSYLIGI